MSWALPGPLLRKRLGPPLSHGLLPKQREYLLLAALLSAQRGQLCAWTRGEGLREKQPAPPEVTHVRQH